jgi:hypothetical protein
VVCTKSAAIGTLHHDSPDVPQMLWKKASEQIPVLRLSRPPIAQPAPLGSRHRFPAKRVLAHKS